MPALSESGVDIRLVVTDLDGTLLDARGSVPDGLWSTLDRLDAAGIPFVPASGRQYAALHRLFADRAEGMPFIAENGTLVVRDGEVLSSTTIAPAFVHAVIDTVREVAERGPNLGAVLCGIESAYIERSDAAFVAEVERYYAKLSVVDDLQQVQDRFLKVAVYDFDDIEADTAVALRRFDTDHQVVVSNTHWVDLMHPQVDKGVAVRELQRELGVTPAQTVAFGDFLNDVQMLEAADLSFAMANAHPDVDRVARYRAPSNAEGGVVTVLNALLDQMGV